MARAKRPCLAQLLLFPLRNELAQKSTNPLLFLRRQTVLVGEWEWGLKEGGGGREEEEAYATLRHLDLLFPAPALLNPEFSSRKL